MFISICVYKIDIKHPCIQNGCGWLYFELNIGLDTKVFMHVQRVNFYASIFVCGMQTSNGFEFSTLEFTLHCYSRRVKYHRPMWCLPSFILHLNFIFGAWGLCGLDNPWRNYAYELDNSQLKTFCIGIKHLPLEDLCVGVRQHQP